MSLPDTRYQIVHVRFTVNDPGARITEMLTKATFLFDTTATSSAQRVIDAVNGENAHHRALQAAVSQWRTRIVSERPFDVLTWNLFLTTGTRELAANGLERLSDAHNGEKVYVGENPTQFADRTPTNQLTFDF
jgi:hypothetical protein